MWNYDFENHVKPWILYITTCWRAVSKGMTIKPNVTLDSCASVETQYLKEGRQRCLCAFGANHTWNRNVTNNGEETRNNIAWAGGTQDVQLEEEKIQGFKL